MKALTVADVAQRTGYTKLVVREWVASGECPFGFVVNIPGSSKRKFCFNEAALEKWEKGEMRCG